MKSMKNIRRNAYNSLAGKWGVSITACLIYNLISTNGLKHIDNSFTQLFSILSRFIDKNPYESWKDSITQVLKALPFYELISPTLLIASIIFIMLAAPLNMGICRVMLDLANEKKDVRLKDAFIYYKTHFWKTIGVQSMLFLWALVPIVGIIRIFDYAIVPYIFVEEPNLPVTAILRRSKDIMYGNRWWYIKLRLTLIVWILLCFLTLGIATIWFSPYSNSVDANFYRELMQERKGKKKQLRQREGT